MWFEYDIEYSLPTAKYSLGYTECQTNQTKLHIPTNKIPQVYKYKV